MKRTGSPTAAAFGRATIAPIRTNPAIGFPAAVLAASAAVPAATTPAAAQSADWLLSGNAGTTAADFLGTTDDDPLVVKTNGKEAFRVTAAGKIGIGTESPSALLTVAGLLKTHTLQIETGAQPRASCRPPMRAATPPGGPERRVRRVPPASLRCPMPDRPR
jgi:hypothetical protein